MASSHTDVRAVNSEAEDSEDGTEHEQTSHSNIHKSKKTLRFRSVDSGYWVAFLLPGAIYISDLNLQRESATAVAIIAYNVFLLCAFQWLQLNFYMLLRRLKNMNYAISGVIICIVFFHGGNIYEIASYLALNFSFPYLFYNLLRQHPRSFSFGEGVLVTSAFAYRFWGASQNLPFPQPETQIHSLSETDLVTMLLQILFFATLLGARLILLLQKPWKLFILEEMLCLWSKYCVMAFFTRIPIQNDDMSMFIITWPFKFLIATPTRVRLIASWALICLCTGLILVYQKLISRRTTTIDRKIFHFAIVAVFLPGIAYDHTLIYCCSAIVFYIFVLLETLRVLKFEVVGFNFGVIIDFWVSGFRDYQDEGRLLLTPVYLLVGCALPIWLTDVEDGNILTPVQYSAAIAGILSIGIGDTFASIGGSLFGRTRWKGSQKTVEGTVCSIIAQITFAAVIFITEILPCDHVSVFGLGVAITLNAFVEGNTKQIDNLCLPLLTFIVVHGFNLIFSKINEAAEAK